LQDKEAKLNLLAVGDDDQNIYEFNGAQVEFIRRFEQDYSAKVDYLVENFRSTVHIINAANALINKHPDRLKQEHPIAINSTRRKEAAGGVWTRRDAAVSAGRVQLLDGLENYQTQAWVVLQELCRLKELDTDWDWSRVGVISREWKALAPVRAGCELLKIPCQFAGQRDRSPPIRRLREVARFLKVLDAHRGELLPVSLLQAWADKLRGLEAETIGNLLLDEFIEDFTVTFGEGNQPVAVVLNAAYEFFAEADRRNGKGLCLTTAHGAKGLEFNHVVVLDGGWRTGGSEGLSERRLYYVAMTRARQTLTLCRLNGKTFADELVVLPGLFARSPLVTDIPSNLSRRYELLGLGDVYIDFAGLRHNGTVRWAIAELNIGDELIFATVPGKNYLEIRNVNGQVIGRTAKSYKPPEGCIVSARVASICVWQSQEISSEDRISITIPEWEIVLPELVIEP
jgi:ATP-dependent DNA helicase RecQ